MGAQRVVLGVGLVILIAACAPPTQTVGAGQAPVATDVPAPAESFPPAQGEPATTTPSASATPTPVSLNPDGPYILFEGYGGMWIANPDGSSPTRVSDVGIGSPYRDLHHAVSVDGERLAVIRSSDSGADLAIIHLPDGEVEQTIRLADRPDPVDQLTPEGLAFHAISNYDMVAWQPGDGRLLAFVGAMDGPTADLYLYDTETQAITRLTDGPSQALAPTWSPDGKYILHFGGSWVEPLGGALIGYNRPDGAWAVRIEDGAVITQPGKDYMHSNFLGWIDDQHYLISHIDEECAARDIDSVAVADGTREPVFEGCFDGYQGFSPETGTVLLSSTACDDCPLGEGTFLLERGDDEPRAIWDERAWEITYLPESRAFDVYELGVVSDEGSLLPVPADTSQIAVSRQGYIAWLEMTGPQDWQVQVGRPLDGMQVIDLPLGALIWDPIDGTTLVGSTDGKVYAASAPDFAPREAGVLGDGAEQAIWVP
jgi:dipeptidyl aminopeptidase/acylaminoacyl peptidase